MKKITILIVLLVSSFVNTVNLFSQGIDKPRYQVITHRAGVYLGTFNIELFPLVAPLAVANFDSLVSVQFYDSTAFHRVVPNFVIQGGDPNSINGPVSTWGLGNPNQPTVPAEFSVVRHLRGIIGAARDIDTNSANSQFYICVINTPSLDGQYTVYGHVTAGMDVVDTIVNSPRDINDVPLQKIEMFISLTGVNDSVPDTPVLISPADSAQGVLPTQNLIWSNISDAVLYHIQISSDSLFNSIVFDKNVGSNSIKFPGMIGSANYFWRVKSNNGGHESGWSSVLSFNSGTAASNLIYPANGTTGVFTNPVFSWNSVPNATDYTLQVYKSTTIIPANLVYSQPGLIDTTQQVIIPNVNTIYSWRIRTANGPVQGFYSPFFSFTTGTLAGIDQIESKNEKFSVEKIFPNPTKNKLHVNLQFHETGIVHFSLKNMQGIEVYAASQTIHEKKISKVIDVEKLTKGIYLFQISFNGLSINRKITIE